MTQTASPNADVRISSLSRAGFKEVGPPQGFGPLWHTFHVENEGMKGDFHVCAPNDLCQITIHDLMVPKDTLLEFKLPEYLSVAYYKSISGEELTPYRKMRAKSIWGFYSSGTEWRGIIHGGIPIQAVSIQIYPAMSEAYLDQEYNGQFCQVCDAFSSLSDGRGFPEMRALLSRLWPQPGDEGRRALYYEGKVFEAMGLIVERTKSYPCAPRRPVAATDREHILAITSYIDDHCASNLHIADLAHMACMGPTKFKECFKAVTGSTLTQYIQGRRICQAELLLRQPEFSIEQIAHAVGYSCAGRFSELFRREIGLLPSEYRSELR